MSCTLTLEAVEREIQEVGFISRREHELKCSQSRKINFWIVWFYMIDSVREIEKSLYTQLEILPNFLLAAHKSNIRGLLEIAENIEKKIKAGEASVNLDDLGDDDFFATLKYLRSKHAQWNLPRNEELARLVRAA